MSGHGHHDADADSHAGHDDHANETTSDDFPADEPRSPGWLPLLGGALLLGGIFTFVAFSGDDTAAVGAEAAPAAASAAPAVRPAPPIAPGAALPPNHGQFLPRPNP